MTPLDTLGLVLSNEYERTGVPWPDAVREAWDVAKDAEDLIPMIVRPTGRTIPDLRFREHLCEWQRQVRPVAAALPELSDAQIVAIRDGLLPSQGEPFDCVAFARAIAFAIRHGPDAALREGK